MPIILLDDLSNFLREANKEYHLADEAVKDNPLLVSPGYLKRRESAAESFYPHIVSRLMKGDDTVDASVASVRLYFGTYSEDVTNGWRELFNLMEHTRQALLKKRTIAKRFRLELPIHWEMVEDQPYPAWMGFMDLKYTIAQPQEELEYNGRP